MRSSYSVEGADVDTVGVCDKNEKDKNTRSVRRHLSAVRLCFSSRQVTSTTTLSPSMVASTILSTSMVGVHHLVHLPAVDHKVVVAHLRVVRLCFISPDRVKCLTQKNLGSRVAMLPGKFLRVRKVFARINEKTF